MRTEADEERLKPGLLYSDILRNVHSHLAGAWGIAPDKAEAETFALSIRDGPPLPGAGGDGRERSVGRNPGARERQ